MTSAIGENCEIESWEFIDAKKACPCITTKYTSIESELEAIKEKLTDSEKELKMKNDILNVFFDEFLTFECEMNNDSPLSCCIQNLEVDKEKMKVIKVLIDEGSFVGAEDLTELEILNSNIKFIPKNIFDIMPALEAFTIIRSSLTSITRGSFKGADNIESITIEGNIISDLGPHIFEGAETVLQLMLSENRINTVDPDAFKGLKSLKVLSLRDNNIKKLNVNVLKDNISLQKLTLSHNKVDEVDDKLLMHNPELIYFKFNNNKLSGNHQNLTQYAKNKLISDFGGQDNDDDDEEEKS